MTENPLIPEIPEASFWLRFSKTGPIRFISHLDLTRTFHRAFRRAGIELKTSAGFTPHPKFSFALPLSVGMESLAELASFTVIGTPAPQEVLSRLQKEMPAGIELLEISASEGKFSSIAAAEYEIFLPSLLPEKIAQLEEVLSAPEILVEKKNKKGKMVEKDIRPGILSFSAAEKAGGVCLTCRLVAGGEEYLNPELLVRAMEKSFSEEELFGKNIVRKSLFRENGERF